MILTEGRELEEILTELAAVAVEQGVRCVDSDGGCVYGNGRGHHCFVGHFLPEDRLDLMSATGG